MALVPNLHAPTGTASLFSRLRKDAAGNTLAMIAASIIPLLAMIGGGIDMGRSYLSQTRLQQACDAGVLAARKKLGSAVVLDGVIPADAVTAGNQFFNVNFKDGAYGTENRSFAMTLEEDYSITGEASVKVPTTIMDLFGYDEVDLDLTCQAKLNFSNTDVMFVLDTTGSMAWTNPGDSEPKINILRTVVQNFATQLQGSKNPGTRIRYGFVPYSTNVNVGTLLKSDWMVDEWDYHGRVAKETGVWHNYDIYSTTYTYISGSQAGIATYVATSCPASTVTWTTLSHSVDPDGTEHGTTKVTGDAFSCGISADGTSVNVNGTRYSDYTYSWVRKKTGTESREIYKWQYRPVTQDVSLIKGASGDSLVHTATLGVPMYGYPSPTPATLNTYFRGCIEERDTYEIDDYDHVDLSKALDLDIDRIPTPGDVKTQWRPMFNEISFEPEIWWNGTGTFKTSPVTTTNDYLMAGWAGLSACPAAARKLSEMTVADVVSYMSTLTPQGSTYHDIGMIWGGRLLSPTGLFAGENADQSGKPTSRHMIFLTDGETAPLDLSYATYGIEPLDKRRWDPNNPKLGLNLTQVVERRFAVACKEVRKRNITVWVIGFGTSLNPIMTECAGPGHSFEADDSAELNEVFSKIAAKLGDLRVSK